MTVRCLASPDDAPGAGERFRPLPLLGNPHVQTFLGAWLPGPSLRTQRQHIVWLPDGDGLVLHENVPPAWRPGQAMALILHGLGGSAASVYTRRLAVMLLAHGVRVVRMDLRGARGGLPLARQVYHCGRSDDIRAALLAMHRWSPSSPLLLLGVSLGGNLALRVAGELDAFPAPALKRMATLSPPIDLARCERLLAHPRNRFYEDMFVREVLADARHRQRHFPDLPPLQFPRGRLTFRLFDEHYTAPRNGFASAEEYYRRSSPAPLLSRIGIPTLILTARDDPFVAIEPFEEALASDNVVLRILPQGGHIGFIGRDGAGGVRWAERRLVEWVLADETFANHRVTG